MYVTINPQESRNLGLQCAGSYLETTWNLNLSYVPPPNTQHTMLSLAGLSPLAFQAPITMKANTAFCYGLPGNVGPAGDFDPANFLDGKSELEVNRYREVRNVTSPPARSRGRDHLPTTPRSPAPRAPHRSPCMPPVRRPSSPTAAWACSRPSASSCRRSSTRSSPETADPPSTRSRSSRPLYGSVSRW